MRGVRSIGLVVFSCFNFPSLFIIFLIFINHALTIEIWGSLFLFSTTSLLSYYGEQNLQPTQRSVARGVWLHPRFPISYVFAFGSNPLSQSRLRQKKRWLAKICRL
jgi:hypothetical protein